MKLKEINKIRGRLITEFPECKIQEISSAFKGKKIKIIHPDTKIKTQGIITGIVPAMNGTRVIFKDNKTVNNLVLPKKYPCIIS